MHEVIGIEMIPMPWEAVPSLPHDESWKEIIEHCFEHDPLPWCKKEENGLHDTSGRDRFDFQVTPHAEPEEQDGSTPSTSTSRSGKAVLTLKFWLPRTHGEMEIMTDYESVVVGSTPAGCTR